MELAEANTFQLCHKSQIQIRRIHEEPFFNSNEPNIFMETNPFVTKPTRWPKIYSSLQIVDFF